MPPKTGAGSRFATTQWSLVLAAGARGSAEAEEGLARLCTLYWYPVFAFVRRQGHPTDEAQDLTQGFFTRLIEKGDLTGADRSRGRFRNAWVGVLTTETFRPEPSESGIAGKIPALLEDGRLEVQTSLVDGKHLSWEP